jgi:ribosomal silencing factor RsfS
MWTSPFSSFSSTRSTSHGASIPEEFEEAWSEADLPPCRVSGAGTTGWVVAVSLLAPFAVIELGEVVVFEDGSTTEAEIEPYGD